MVAHETTPDAVPLPSDVEVDVVDTEASAEVMGLLSEHVPLALLADLALPTGPESPAILEEEGLPDVEWWAHTDEGAETPTAAPTGEDEASQG